MIEFICGKPGEGKTLYSVRLMLDHFRDYLRGYTPRKMVTNVKLNYERVVAYFTPEFEEMTPLQILEKIQACAEIISDDELSFFFRHRGNSLYLDTDWDLEHQGFKQKQPDYSKSEGGVLYILDEIHTAFNARRWSSNGEYALFYLSQHRKLGDDVICITQHPDQVDKQFRMLTQNYHVIRNNYRRKFMGVKSRGCFERETFGELPRFGSVAFEKETFYLNFNICSCYDTTAGVGVGGGRPVQEKKVKGLPWWTLIVVFVGIAIALFSGVEILSRGLQWFFNSADVGTAVPGVSTQLKTENSKESVNSTTPEMVSQKTETKPVKINIKTGLVFYNDDTSKLIKNTNHKVEVNGNKAWVDGESVEVAGMEVFKTVNPFEK